MRDLRNTSTREHFVECKVISPLHFRQQGQYIIMPVSEYVRNACSKWNLQRMFKEHYGDPVTLADLGVTDDMMEQIAEVLCTVWERGIPMQPSGDVSDPVRAELQPSVRPESIIDCGPFSDRQKNAVWAAA
eukprot:29741-Rhodomonas_salina.1